MITTQDDELATAARVLVDAGFDIVVKEQWQRLRGWLDAGGAGYPPAMWKVGEPVIHRRDYDATRSWHTNAERERRL